MIARVVSAALPGARWTTQPAAHPYTTRGRQIDVDGIEIGECGLAAITRPGTWGLAMGLGLDRLVMLRKGIDDIRLLRATDPRIASQMLDLAPYRPVSAMPPVLRDLSIAVDAPLDAEALGDAVRSILGDRADLLKTCEVLSTTPASELPPAAAARELASGDHVPWNGVAYHDHALYVAEGGERDGGRIVRFDLDGDHVSKQTVLVDNLPSLGDHHTNGPVVASDGWVYFGQGTATNAGVVGPDNQQFGWLARNRDFHDTPCRDVTLTGVNFTSDDPLGQAKVTTGAYLPYGTPSERGQVIKGQVPCNGAVMRVKTTGGPIELVAWGFRNPFGLALDRGTLYVTDNGYDMRGSRPVFGAADVLWKVEMSHWYGWPDYSEGRPLTASFYSEGGGKPAGFLLAQHPETPPEPAAYFPVHSSADGLDFSHGEAFGYPGWAFVALFGDMAPTAGKVLGPVGFDIMRVDPATGDLAEFARNRGDKPGPASQKHQRGFERPVAVRFDPSGAALYVVDFGVIRMTDHGAEPERESGRIWKIVKEARYASDD
jgi:glucose/arabinose dehydrogenase